MKAEGGKEAKGRTHTQVHTQRKASVQMLRPPTGGITDTTALPPGKYATLYLTGYIVPAKKQCKFP